MRMRVFKMSSLLLILVMSMIKVQAATYTVTNVDDTGTGSLRDAIVLANASAGKDTVDFNIPIALTTGGKFVISFASNQDITESLVIIGPVDIQNKPLVHLVNGGAPSVRGFVFVVGCDYSEVKNIEISGFGYGVIIGISKYCVVENNYLHDNGYGVGISGNCDSTKIISNLIDQCTYGVQLTYGSNPMATGNRVSVGAYGKGNVIQNCTQYAITYFAQPSDNLIQYNIIKGCQAGGIQLGGGAFNFIIRHNEILDNNGHGIECVSGVVDNLIEKNYIGVDMNGNAHGNTGSGIHINHFRNNTVVGNVIAYNQNGITVGGTATANQNKLSRNIIYGNTVKAINLNLSMATPGNNGRPAPLILSTYTTDATGYQISGMSFPNDSIELYSTEFNVQNIIKHVASLQAAGDGSWSYTIPYSELPDSLVLYITVIGIDANNNTSEVGNTPLKLTCSCIVTNVNNDGDGSLRQALYCANAKKSHATISYEIAGAGPYVIALSGAPLFVTNPYGITMDGETQALSGAGTGDQTVNIQAGVIFPQATCGPSSYSNLTFSNSPFGIFSLADSVTVSDNKFVSSSLRIYLTASTDSNKVVVKDNDFSGGVFGVDVQYINGLSVRDNVISNTMGGTGVRVFGGYDVKVNNNQITNSTGTGIGLQSVNKVQVNANDITGNNAGTAILMFDADYGTINHNKILDTYNGIIFGQIYSFEIKENYIQDYTYGLNIYAGLGSSKVDIAYDTLLSGLDKGMHLSLDSSNVSYCYVDDCITGIEFAGNQGGIDNSKINNNEIYNFRLAGFNMGQGEDNMFEDNIVANGEGIAILIPRLHDDLIIRNNKIGIDKNNNPAIVSGIGIRAIPTGCCLSLDIESNTIGNIKFATTDPYNLFTFVPSGVAVVTGYSNTFNIKNNFIGTDDLDNIHPCDSMGFFAWANSSFGEISGNKIVNTPIAVYLSDATDFYVKENVIGNAEKGIVVKSSIPNYSIRNKISRNRFSDVQNNLIDIYINDVNSVSNNSKLSPDFIGYAPQINQLLIHGSNAVRKDTIEVYQSLTSGDIVYVGYGVADVSGNWKAYVPLTSVDLLQPLVLYANTTDTLGNTSEFKSISNIPLNLCSSNILNTLPATLSACESDSALADALITGPVTYNWLYQNVSVGTAQTEYLTNAGDYVVQVTDGNSCMASDTVVMSLNPLPSDADFLMTSMAGVGDEVVLVNITPAQFNPTWDFGPAVATPTSYGYDLVYAATGDYEVEMIAHHSNGCSKTTVHYIHINPTGTPPSGGGGFTYYIKDVTIAPNPSTGVFDILVNMEEAEGVTVDILSSLGMPVYKKEYTDKVFTHVLNTDIQSLPTGQYIVRITSQSDSRILRIVKL